MQLRWQHDMGDMTSRIISSKRKEILVSLLQRSMGARWRVMMGL